MMIWNKLERLHIKLHKMVFGEMWPNPHDIHAAVNPATNKLYFDPWEYRNTEWDIKNPPIEGLWASETEVRVMSLAEFLMREDTILPKYVALNEMMKPYMSPYNYDIADGSWTITNPPTPDGKALWGDQDHVIVISTKKYLRYMFHERYVPFVWEFMKGKRFYSD